jgi:DNA-binding NarL/FixJ family response regulator
VIRDRPGPMMLRQPPVHVALDIADRALRADIRDACDDAGITTADHGEITGDVDVVLIDRPVATAIPAVAVVAGETRRVWPPNVFAVIPADTDAETLAAVIMVVAAGYALAARTDHANRDVYQDAEQDAGHDGENGAGGPLAWADDAADTPAVNLSVREREVLALLAEGASNKEIAIALAVSVSTVKFHVAAIMAKLDARSRVDAVAIAIRNGLVMV